MPLAWRLQKEHAGSGALGDIAAHVVDLARFLVGEIAEVTGDLTIKDVITGHGVYPMPIGGKGLAMVDTRDLAEVAAIERRLGPFGHPVFAIVAYTGIMWVWHIPSLYEAALENPFVHVLEHVSFAAAGHHPPGGPAHSLPVDVFAHGPAPISLEQRHFVGRPKAMCIPLRPVRIGFEMPNVQAFTDPAVDLIPIRGSFERRSTGRCRPSACVSVSQRSARPSA